MYRPEFEHDACGVGFFANISGKKEFRILDYAIQALCNLAHRGALDADAKTGDGAGVLTQIPHALFRREVPGGRLMIESVPRATLIPAASMSRYRCGPKWT